MLGPVLSLALTSILVMASISRAEPASPRLDAVAQDPVWLALLHQSRHSITGKTRKAFEEARFFYAQDGAKQPLLELVATREAFLGPDPIAAQQARCRFPARYQFLIEQGLLPNASRGLCPDLDAWRARIGEVKLTLIFPDAFLGNPASMFGHTLLRFDPVDHEIAGADESLLGWTLDYTANAGGDGGITYMVRGLTGEYTGKFGIAPYYEKTKLYSDWQDRDIWEYPLSLSGPDLERVLLHVWEIQDLLLPYYFFTQNCSEKLLEVLEVGWPDLGRGGGFPPTVAPVDTVRAMAQARPDAVGTPTLRASPASKLQDALGNLSRSAASAVENLAWGRMAPDSPALDAFSEATRAEILSQAYDLLRHTYLAGKISDEDSRTRARALLRARSRIDIQATSDDELLHLHRIAPDQGHGTARALLSGGIQDRDGFIELRLMPPITRTSTPRADSPRAAKSRSSRRPLGTTPNSIGFACMNSSCLMSPVRAPGGVPSAPSPGTPRSAYGRDSFPKNGAADSQPPRSFVCKAESGPQSRPWRVSISIPSRRPCSRPRPTSKAMPPPAPWLGPASPGRRVGADTRLCSRAWPAPSSAATPLPGSVQSSNSASAWGGNGQPCSADTSSVPTMSDISRAESA